MQKTVCVGFIPKNYSQQGILESWFPEIKDIKNTHFCSCPDECAEMQVNESELKHIVIKLTEEQAYHLNPVDPFTPENPNLFYRPLSRICSCIIL